jgi:hypothetical protein
MIFAAVAPVKVGYFVMYVWEKELQFVLFVKEKRLSCVKDVMARQAFHATCATETDSFYALNVTGLVLLG